MSIVNILKVTLDSGALSEHYQSGMFKLLELPVLYGMDYCDNEFFAYVSTLGGGLVGGDDYTQEFNLVNTKATLASQSNQKVYKGRAKLSTTISLDCNSVLVFHNDANIFYKDCDFWGQTKLFARTQSKFFILDGGYLGYAEADFKANMQLRIFIDHRLAINDAFNYFTVSNVNALYNYDYFYSIIIRGLSEVPCINSKNIKAYASSVGGNLIVRVLSSSNDLALQYISELKSHFLSVSHMSAVSY